MAIPLRTRPSGSNEPAPAPTRRSPRLLAVPPSKPTVVLDTPKPAPRRRKAPVNQSQSVVQQSVGPIRSVKGRKAPTSPTIDNGAPVPPTIAPTVTLPKSTQTMLSLESQTGSQSATPAAPAKASKRKFEDEDEETTTSSPIKTRSMRRSVASQEAIEPIVCVPLKKKRKEAAADEAQPRDSNPTAAAEEQVQHISPPVKGKLRKVREAKKVVEPPVRPEHLRSSARVASIASACKSTATKVAKSIGSLFPAKSSKKSKKASVNDVLPVASVESAEAEVETPTVHDSSSSTLVDSSAPLPAPSPAVIPTAIVISESTLTQSAEAEVEMPTVNDNSSSTHVDSSIPLPAPSTADIPTATSPSIVVNESTLPPLSESAHVKTQEPTTSSTTTPHALSVTDSSTTPPGSPTRSIVTLSPPSLKLSPLKAVSPIRRVAYGRPIAPPYVSSPLSPFKHAAFPPSSPPYSPPLDAVELGPLPSLHLPPTTVGLTAAIASAEHFFRTSTYSTLAYALSPPPTSAPVSPPHAAPGTMSAVSAINYSPATVASSTSLESVCETMTSASILPEDSKLSELAEENSVATGYSSTLIGLGSTASEGCSVRVDLTEVPSVTHTELLMPSYVSAEYLSPDGFSSTSSDGSTGSSSELVREDCLAVVELPMPQYPYIDTRYEQDQTFLSGDLDMSEVTVQMSNDLAQMQREIDASMDMEMPMDTSQDMSVSESDLGFGFQEGQYVGQTQLDAGMSYEHQQYAPLQAEHGQEIVFPSLSEGQVYLEEHAPQVTQVEQEEVTPPIVYRSYIERVAARPKRMHLPLSFKPIGGPEKKEGCFWKQACRVRMLEISRRFPPAAIRELVEDQAYQYHERTNTFPPNYLRNRLRGPTPSDDDESDEESEAFDEDEDDFMHEKIYAFELEDDPMEDGDELADSSFDNFMPVDPPDGEYLQYVGGETETGWDDDETDDDSDDDDDMELVASTHLFVNPFAGNGSAWIVDSALAGGNGPAGGYTIMELDLQAGPQEPWILGESLPPSQSVFYVAPLGTHIHFDPMAFPDTRNVKLRWDYEDMFNTDGPPILRPNLGLFVVPLDIPRLLHAPVSHLRGGADVLTWPVVGTLPLQDRYAAWAASPLHLPIIANRLGSSKYLAAVDAEIEAAEAQIAEAQAAAAQAAEAQAAEAQAAEAQASRKRSREDDDEDDTEGYARSRPRPRLDSDSNSSSQYQSTSSTSGEFDNTHSESSNQANDSMDMDTNMDMGAYQESSAQASGNMGAYHESSQTDVNMGVTYHESSQTDVNMGAYNESFQTDVNMGAYNEAQANDLSDNMPYDHPSSSLIPAPAPMMADEIDWSLLQHFQDGARKAGGLTPAQQHAQQGSSANTYAMSVYQNHGTWYNQTTPYTDENGMPMHSMMDGYPSNEQPSGGSSTSSSSSLQFALG